MTPAASLGYATDLTPGVGTALSPIGIPNVHTAAVLNHLHLVPEVIAPVAGKAPLQRVYMQGWYANPETGDGLTTNPVAVTISP